MSSSNRILKETRLLFLVFGFFLLISSKDTPPQIVEFSLKPYLIENDKLNNDFNRYEFNKYFDNFTFKGFMESFITFSISGFGDKSFFVTTVACLSFNNFTVMIASFFALTLMGIISIFVGIEATKLIPGYVINLISVSLFLIMGIKMMLEGLEMRDEAIEEQIEIGDGKDQEDNYESENSLTEKKARRVIENDEIYNSDINNEEQEKNILIRNNKSSKSRFSGINYPHMNTFIYEFSQIFMIVFLGELGDRSQISTIYMVNQTSVCNVLLAVIFANIILSVLSVLFGNFISKRFSMKNLYLYTGGSFVLFGMITLFVTMQEDFGIFDYYKMNE